MEALSIAIAAIGAAFLGVSVLRLRPRRLAARRLDLEAALGAWQQLVAAEPGLVLRTRAAVTGTRLSGALRDRMLRAEVRDGGGGGAEAEFTTHVALSTRLPLSPATQLWPRGAAPQRRRGPRARVAHADVLVEGPDARALRRGVAVFGRLMREEPSLRVVEGWICVERPDLCPELGGLVGRLEGLAEALEADLRQPWLRAACGCGLALVRQGQSVWLEGRRSGGWRLSVALVAEGTLVTVALSLPEDTAIRCRRPGEAGVAGVGNPIADALLRIEGGLARAALRTAEGTAAALAVLHAWPLSRVSAEGIHLLASVDAIRGGSLESLVEAAEALAACLSGASADGDGGG